MLTNELPSGGYDQVLFGIRQCLAENRGAVAELGNGRYFLAGELLPLVQYGAEHGDDNHPLGHVIVAIGAAGLGDDIEYRLTVVRPDPESTDDEGLYITVREDLFHTDPRRQNLDDFDAAEGNDWLRRLGDARYSPEASWFHISSDDGSEIMQAATWGDHETQQRLESRQRLEEWRGIRKYWPRRKERATDYDY
jgi:hypothetical protein